ncbi:MAG TPA: sigma-70 family RNA polymerase sigma factor [Caulobacteraceae bacterium]|nr:sigma-70 family RNA polymerase sigma factor [Caulobacteraceae bacterium]
MSAAAQSAGGERQARLLEEWSRRYRPALLSFFQRRMPPGAEREDLVQEVFLRLARQDLSTIANVEGYLFQAAANVLKDWRRRGVRREADAHDPIQEDLPAEVGFSPERVLLGKDAVATLIAALEALPERTRVVFLLYHFEQLTQAEIARRLGIAVRTVENNMAKAHAHVAAVMLERRP